MRPSGYPAFILLALASCAHAWWEVPHMLTAGVAKQALLNAERHTTLQMVTELVDVLGPRYPKSADFLSAAVWADDIKGLRDHRFDGWHFIDIPILDGVQSGPAIPAENIVWALDLLLENLSADTPIPNLDNGKATAVRFVLHFLGDLSQPLHCSTHVTQALPGGDRGGNLFKIIDEPDDISNLHSFWDNAGGAFPGLQRNDTPAVFAAAGVLMAEVPVESLPQFVPGECNATKWAYESYGIASNVAYTGVTYNATVPALYRDEVQQVAKQQVVLGGLRLAECLHIAMQASGPFSKPSDGGDGISKVVFGVVVGVLGAVAVAAVVVAVTLHRRRTSRFASRPSAAADPALEASTYNKGNYQSVA